MSPATEAAIIGGIAGGAAGGLFTVLGVLLGLFGERWVRRWGRVRCDIKWEVLNSETHPDEDKVTARTLDVRFLNSKDIDVNVLQMKVEFYRGHGILLEEPEAPLVWFSREGVLHLPSRKPESVMIRVDADTEVQRAAMEKVSRAFFVAEIDGARDKRKPLRPPWKLA